MGKNTHRFDKWMVKFLTAHALDMEDKEDNGTETQEDIQRIPGYAQLERNRITETLMMEVQDQSHVYWAA